MRFRRKVGVTAAASLDPFDGEDVTSLFTRVRWAEGMISEFRASAAKKHKAVGEFPKVPALAPDLIEAFSQYWKDRTVAQVKFHTVCDLVEACFEATSFPNFKALRSALERLLANMGIKTVRHMCELPLVPRPLRLRTARPLAPRPSGGAAPAAPARSGMPRERPLRAACGREGRVRCASAMRLVYTRHR